MKKIAARARRSNERGLYVRPFFGYYGGKWRDALKHYPAPAFDTLIEPFAGSAGYALRYHYKRVILCERDPIVAGVWDYLIKVTTAEILSLPDVPLEGSVDDLNVCQEAKWLIGFWLNRGVAMPRKSPSRWMRDEIRPGSFWGDRVRQTVASQLRLIRHWKIYNRTYDKCPVPRKNKTKPGFTWFIDPPYQCAGKHYRFGADEINYPALAQWCKSRPGQVIVCENEGAKWLPFKSLAEVKTTRTERLSKETYWMNTFKVRAAPAVRPVQSQIGL